jgi:methionyl-tRNA formyltransferase
MAALAEMMDEALAALASGSAPRIMQDERYATWAARRTPADGLVDWSCTAEDIALLVRAVGRPYPGARSFDGPHRLTLWSAKPIEGGARHSAAPGQVVWRTDTSFAVMCGNGELLQVDDWDHPEARAPRAHVRLTNTPAVPRKQPLAATADQPALEPGARRA